MPALISPASEILTKTSSSQGQNFYSLTQGRKKNMTGKYFDLYYISLFPVQQDVQHGILYILDKIEVFYLYPTFFTDKFKKIFIN